MKIIEEGQPCRWCGMPVQKKTHPPRWKPKPKQPFYFEWWLRCPGCRAIYMVEEAKRWIKPRKPKMIPDHYLDVDEQFKLRLEREK